MPDLLGVTNPVPGHDNTQINRNIPVSPGNTQIQNVPDTTKVNGQCRSRLLGPPMFLF